MSFNRTRKFARRESYARAKALCEPNGLHCTKRAFTALAADPAISPDKSWVVFKTPENWGRMSSQERRVYAYSLKRESVQLVSTLGALEIRFPEIHAALNGSAPIVPADPSIVERLEGISTDTDSEPDTGSTTVEREPTVSVPSVSEERIRAIAREEDSRFLQRTDSGSFSDIIRAKANVAARELFNAEAREIVRAEIAAQTPTRVEIVIPERKPITCEGKHPQWRAIIEELAVGNNIFISGPSGSGKTTVCINAAKELGLVPIVIPAPSDSFEVFGYRSATGEYIPSALYRALVHPEPCAIVFDEIDASDPKALLACNSILAGNGFATFPHESISINPAHRILATANTWGLGANAEYCGRSKLDGATLNRFQARISFGYDETSERAWIVANGGDDTLADRCFAIRAALADRGIKLAWTPRDSIALARRVAAGIPWDDAIGRSALALLDPAKRADILRSVR